MDVVIMTLFRWDATYASITRALAKEFVKEHRVFYFNHPFTYKDFRDKKPEDFKPGQYDILKNGGYFHETREDGVIVITPPVIWSINFLPKGRIYDMAWKRNNDSALKVMDEMVAHYNIKDFLFLNCYNPFVLPNLPERFDTKIQVYQSIDDIEESEYMAKHGMPLEKKACEKADLVTVTSTELHRLKSPFNTNTHWLPNAAEIANFQRARTEKFERPDAIKHINKPTIGFIGNLDDRRIDFELIKKVAEHHPDKEVVLVGPVNSPKLTQLGIDKMSNVTLGGSQPITELPAWLQYFDCAIIPFEKNRLTRSIYPLKINEYLAAGQAVIATHFSDDIASFSDIIYLAEDHDEFLKLIDKSIEENSEKHIAERVAVASENTWGARVRQLFKLIDQTLAKETVSS